MLLALIVSALTAPEAEARVIAVIVHKATPVRSLGRSEIRDIFLKRRTAWPGTERIIPVNAAVGSSLRKAFDKKFLRMSQDQMATYWINEAIRGQRRPPRQLPSEAVTVRLVSMLKGAIGYVSLERVTDRVKVLAVDGRLPTDPTYRYRDK